MTPAGRRAKGANGEKEVLLILEDELGLKLVRNKQQTARGGRDIAEDVDRMQGPIPFSIEVKRQEAECLPAWWKQTVDQAEAVNRVPVLFYRASRQPWRVAVDPHDINAETWPQRSGRFAILDLVSGLQWMREKL